MTWQKKPSQLNKDSFAAVSKQYKLAVYKAKAASFATRIANANSDTRELFTILRELENPAPPPDSVPASPDWCTEIQLALANKITQLRAKISAKQATIRHKPTLTNAPTPDSTHTFDFSPVTESEIAKIIRTLKPSICKGDACPAPLTKDCIPPLLPLITQLINASFSSSTVPDTIKEAWVTPLLKKPTIDPRNPANYRPITTVPFLLKILDRVAYLQIQHHLESHHLLGTRQSGFRPGHGTETALLDLKLQLDRARDSGKLSLLLLLDLSAAFDLVDHLTLCTHLTQSAHFSPSATAWVSSFLSGRTSKVSIGPHSALPTPVTCGVPQGSCVSPTLYNVYTKPLFDLLDHLGVTYTNFADDTQILIPLSGNHQTDTATVNSVYETIQAWMATHLLCLNDEKTELLIVGLPAQLSKLDPAYSSFLIDNIDIPVSKNVKTLGVYLDCELSLTRHTNAIISATAYSNKLINLARPFLTPNNCLNLARALICTRLDYCNVLLIGTSKSNLAKLQIVQNNALRAALGIPRSEHISDARRTAHWLPVRARIDFKTLCLTHRIHAKEAPSYLLNVITPNANSINLRSNVNHTLRTSRFTRQRAGGSSFYTLAPRLWNTLPLPLRSVPNYASFRKQLKTWLFNKY